MTRVTEHARKLHEQVKTLAEEMFKMFEAGDSEGKYTSIGEHVDDEGALVRGTRIDLSEFGWSAELGKLECPEEVMIFMEG